MNDSDLPMSAGGPFSVALDGRAVGQVAETITAAIQFAGVRDQLRARLAEIERDYAALASSEENTLKERAIAGAIVEVAMKAYIEKGAHDQALECFKQFMQGTPNFIGAVTKVIIRRIEHAPPPSS